jgi:hypothetical protein
MSSPAWSCISTGHVLIVFPLHLCVLIVVGGQAILKRMCKYMYCRARNHRVNFSTILDKAMAMVEAFDRHGHLKNDISPLPYHGGMAESITHEYGLFIQVPHTPHT